MVHAPFERPIGIRGVGCPCPIHGQFPVCFVSPATAGDPGGSPVRSCRSRSEEGHVRDEAGDSDRAAHAASDIRSGLAILALRPIARRERTWPGRIPGKASVLVRLAETCDFKL